MRERRHGGRTLSFVFKHEADAIKTILGNVHPSAKIRVDEAAHWNILHGYYADVKSVNHTKDEYMVKGVHTNWVDCCSRAPPPPPKPECVDRGAVAHLVK